MNIVPSQRLSDNDQNAPRNKFIQAIEQNQKQSNAYQYQKYLPSDSNFEESKDEIFCPEFDDTIERSRNNSFNISKEKQKNER